MSRTSRDPYGNTNRACYWFMQTPFCLPQRGIGGLLYQTFESPVASPMRLPYGELIAKGVYLNGKDQAGVCAPRVVARIIV